MDNRTCCHIGCDYVVRKGKHRCGKCRHNYIYKCAACDLPVPNAARIFCKSCLKIGQQFAYLPNDSKILQFLSCKVCNTALEGSQRVFCSRACNIRYQRVNYHKNKSYTTECLMCFKKKTGGHSLCRGDCLRIYNRLQKQKKRRLTVNLK